MNYTKLVDGWFKNHQPLLDNAFLMSEASVEILTSIVCCYSPQGNIISQPIY